MSTTFGELTGLAEAHLRAAARENSERRPGDAQRDLVNAVVDCMRSVDQLQRLGATAQPPYPDSDKSWRLAARELATSLTGARAALGPQPADAEHVAQRHVLHVRHAAVLVGAAHDLLAAHLAADGPRSDMGALITEEDGRRQVTLVAASLTKALADVVNTIRLDALALDRRPDPATAHRHLVWGAGIVRAAGGGRVPTPDYLLAVASRPSVRRHPVATGESREQLIENMIAAAARLHGASVRDTGRDGVRHYEARSLHTVATAMTAAHAICGQLLGQLAEGGGPSDVKSMPASAAQHLAEARSGQQKSFDAWLRVCDSWREVTGLAETTRSQQLRVDANDLVTRLGRLVYAESDWQPSVRMTGTLRSPVDLAPDGAALAAMLNVVHELTAHSALIATEHARLTSSLAGAGELLVPTATLPDTYDVPYRFARLPGPAQRQLTHEYQVAARGASDAAVPLAAIATLADAAAPTVGRRQAIELTAMRLPGRGPAPLSRCDFLEVEVP
ncbi:MAG: hypothetical protein ABIM89_05680 [Mycobacteriales bacterium]